MNSLCTSCRAMVLRGVRASSSSIPISTSTTTIVSNVPSMSSFLRLSNPITSRTFSTSIVLSAQKQMNKSQKDASAKAKLKRRKKKHTHYKLPDLADLKQYALVDAMQYIRAFEVGRADSSPKYDLAVRLKTKKDGPVLRNQIRLPYSVKTDIKVCVIVPADSKQGRAAKDAGAALVGEQEVFDVIKTGKIDFDRCITTPEMLPKLMKDGLPRILGPRGLMPSVKLGTVTDNVAVSVKNMLGGSTYRERQGVVRMAIGQLGFTPEQLRDNVRAFLSQLRSEAGAMIESQGFSKEVFEVVLSSTNSPGFSLSGEFRTENSVPTSEMVTP